MQQLFGFIAALLFSNHSGALCMIFLFSTLFFEDDNTINQHY